jgi:hypothetical protein
MHQETARTISSANLVNKRVGAVPPVRVQIADLVQIVRHSVATRIGHGTNLRFVKQRRKVCFSPTDALESTLTVAGVR